MSFRTNHSDLPEDQLVKAGDYEAAFCSVVEAQTEAGTPYIGIHVVIRNDIEQPYKNKHVFESLWTSEKAMPYTQRKLNAIDAALELPEAEYESVNDWGKLLTRKPVKIHIGVREAANGYPARNQIERFMKTEHPDISHQWPVAATATATAPASAPQTFTPVSDEELPF